MTTLSRHVAFFIAIITVTFIGLDPLNAKPLNVDDVLRSALRHYPKIIATQNKVLLQEAKASSQLGQFDETLSMSGEWTPEDDYEHQAIKLSLSKKTNIHGTELYTSWKRGVGDFATYDERKSGQGGEATLGFRVPILKGGSIDKERALLQSEQNRTKQRESDLQLEKLMTVWNASNAYWAFRAAVKKQRIAQELLSLAETRTLQIKGRVESGALPEIENVDNQRTVLKRKGVRRLAERKVEATAIKLSLYWRTAEGKMIVPQANQLEDLEHYPSFSFSSKLEQDVERAISLRPEIAALRQTKANWRIKNKLAKNNRLPVLDGFAEASQDLGNDNFGPTAQSLVFGMRFMLPLRQRQARGAIAASSAGEAIVDQKIRLLSNQIETQIRDAHSELRAMMDTLELAKKERVLAHAVENAERERYALGSSNLLNVTLREQAAAESEKRVVEAELAVHIAINRYRFLIGWLPRE